MCNYALMSERLRIIALKKDKNQLRAGIAFGTFTIMHSTAIANRFKREYKQRVLNRRYMEETYF